MPIRRPRCAFPACKKRPGERQDGTPFEFCYDHRAGIPDDPTTFDPLAYRADFEGTPFGVECSICGSPRNGYCVPVAGQKTWSAFRVNGLPQLVHAERLAAVGWPPGPVLVEPFCRLPAGHIGAHGRGFIPFEAGSSYCATRFA